MAYVAMQHNSEMTLRASLQNRFAGAFMAG